MGRRLCRGRPQPVQLAVSFQGFHLKALKHLVLDEADKLLDMDFEQEIDQILKARCHEGRGGPRGKTQGRGAATRTPPAAQ